MEQLKTKIKDKLEKKGFTYSNSSKWVKTSQQTVGGGTISINGKVMQQPGKSVKFTMTYEDLGDCVITDIKTNVDVVSLLGSFKVQQEDELIQDFTINLYPDDFNLFEDLINKIFKIC